MNTTNCLSCLSPIRWVECPTGGWWEHETRKTDGHEPEASADPLQEMDDNGYWHTLEALS